MNRGGPRRDLPDVRGIKSARNLKTGEKAMTTSKHWKWNVTESSRKLVALGTSALLVAGLANVGAVPARSEVQETGTVTAGLVCPQGATGGSAITCSVVTKDIEKYE